MWVYLPAPCRYGLRTVALRFGDQNIPSGILFGETTHFKQPFPCGAGAAFIVHALMRRRRIHTACAVIAPTNTAA
ncbi:MAG: hypothetical protein HOJ31_10170 [Anaerolineae bacterium]|nr:hypothetical protein [Anaerolineae bacterium]